jgi:cytochrome c oxidase assembly protein subunit 15
MDRTANDIQKEGRGFSICLASLLLATLAINLLSGYIRHQEAGLGCETWPDCYGRVGHLIAPIDDARPMAVLTPTETAKQAHRAIATALVVLVLLTVYLAQRSLPGPTQYLPYAIVAVILLLSVVGPASYLKTLPAIATVNMAGGMALLALVWLLWLTTRNDDHSTLPHLRLWAGAALAATVGQILLGAWVSANFAALACVAPFTCGGLADGQGLQSFWYFRELTLDETGRIVMDGTQSLIQLTHHLGAVLTTGILAVLAVLCIRSGRGGVTWGTTLLALLAVQLLLGVGGLLTQLPPVVVLGHNLIASLILLTVIRISLLTRSVQMRTVPTRR